MTPLDVSLTGVALTTLARVPEAARALVAATGAAEVTFRTTETLAELLDGLAELSLNSSPGASAVFGGWGVDLQALLAHLQRAVPADGGEGVDEPVGVGYTHVGPALVLVLADARDAWRVGIVARAQAGLGQDDERFDIVPVAPPGVTLDMPSSPPRGRLRLVRGGG